MFETRRSTLISLYWVLIATGIIPLIFLAMDYFQAPVATETTPVYVTISEPLFSVTFVLLFGFSAAIAIGLNRRILLVPTLCLLALAVLPAYASLQITPEQTDYEAALTDETKSLQERLGILSTRLEGRVVKLSNCKMTGWVNNWDKAMNATCPAGKVLRGAHSVHNNGKEDRRWKFNCCSLVLGDR